MAGIDDWLYEEGTRGRLFVALQDAIALMFTETDWREFAYANGQQDYILHHDRLLRSLHYGDEDYGSCVFQCLEYLWRYDEAALKTLAAHPKLQRRLERKAPEIAAAIAGEVLHVPAVVPSTPTGAEVVRRAFTDADQLLATNGPVSAVDRLHTALHGYFRYLCDEAGLNPAKDASLTALFKLLREGHPALQEVGVHGKDLVRILQGFATVLDAVNTLRNNASVAHPNEELVGEAEASLVINATRTVFNYIVAKVGG